METGINCRVKKDFWEFLFGLASSIVILEKNGGCNGQIPDNLMYCMDFCTNQVTQEFGRKCIVRVFQCSFGEILPVLNRILKKTPTFKTL